MTFEEWWGAMYAEWSAKTGFDTYYTDEVQKLCAQAWDAASDAARTASFAHGAKMHSSKAFCPLWRVHACTCPEDECRGKIALCHTPTTGNVAAPAPTKTYGLAGRPTKARHAMRMDMETFTQPKITGYRQLNEAEAALMNEIKAEGVKLGELVAKLRWTDGLDQRWVSIGATDLQTGLMALTRGVAQPTTF